MISFIVKPLYVREGSTRLGAWRLRRFQEEVRRAVDRGRDTLLVAPTGSGKTLSLLLGDRGAVGVYPNNTLLLDQQRSVHKILVEALGARLVGSYSGEGVDVLRVYELSGGPGELPVEESRRIAVIVLSGRYIGYEHDEEGKLVPKRVRIVRDIVDRICYPRPGEAMPYIVTLATPDTALMVMAGIYRDFEKVGYTVHDLLLAAGEGMESVDMLLSRHRIALVGELGDLASIRQCLLKYPWLIDEFHLYGTYEAYGLLPVLRVYRDYAGWEEPIILSSATPRGALHRLVEQRYKLHRVEEPGSSSGSPEALVRGRTAVEVVPVDVPGRGATKWFRTGDKAPEIVAGRLGEIFETLEAGGNVFIVVDRINQVPGVVQVLVSSGIVPECSVSIKPDGCSSGMERVVVGSESISQGIDRPNVRYGIITAYNWASLLQRFGRIGRRVDSKVVILVPELRRGIPLAGLENKEVTYADFAKAVVDELPDIDMQRLYETQRYLEIMERRSRLLEYTATVSFTQVSKPSETMASLVGLARREHSQLLNMFYGPPDTITKIMTFRSGGFPVLVRKPSGQPEESDISTVLRNYRVEDVTVVKAGQRSMIQLSISLEPERQRLVMSPDPSRQRYTRPDIARYLDGKVTTIGVLAELGYTLRLAPWSARGARGFAIPLTPDVREQPVLLLDLVAELVDAYSYGARGVEVEVGERRLIGLFI